MKKSIIWLLAISLAVLVIGIGTTIAYLIALSPSVNNVFTIGTVEITLSETTGNKYVMAPGVTLRKDPTITVKGGNDECWLFVKVEKDVQLESFCTYAISDGWLPLDGYDGVYYQIVDKSNSDRKFSILKDNQVLVKDTVTEEQLNAISALDFKFTAGAVQCFGFDSPNDAWHTLNS